LVLKIWLNLTQKNLEKLVDFTLENSKEISKIITISLSKNGEILSTEKNQLDVPEMMLEFRLRDSREGQVIPTNWGLCPICLPRPLILEMPSR
jgi:hypothetical protein